MAHVKRVLTADGGALRGVFSAAIIEKMEAVTKKPARELFDSMWGTSTGAMIVCALAQGVPASRMRQLYAEIGPWLMNTTPPGAQLLELQEWLVSAGISKRVVELDVSNGPPLVPGMALRTWKMELLLEALFGDRRLMEMPTHVAVTVADTRTGRTAYLDNAKGSTSRELMLRHAVRLSTALPPLFSPAQDRYLDGGVSAFANPSVLATRVLTDPEGPMRWRAGKEALRVYSVGTAFHAALLGGDGLMEGLARRYAQFTSEDKGAQYIERMSQFMVDVLMQAMNYSQHDIMLDKHREGELGYIRYNALLDADFLHAHEKALEDIGVEVPKQRELAVRKALDLFDMNAANGVATLGDIGALVASHQVAADQFGKKVVEIHPRSGEPIAAPTRRSAHPPRRARLHPA